MIEDHMSETLTQALIVLHPFRTYKKGDIIRDVATVADIKASVPPTNFVVASIPAAVASAENKQ